MPPIRKLLAPVVVVVVVVFVVVVCITLELLETSPGLSMPIADNGELETMSATHVPSDYYTDFSINCSGSNVSQNTYAHDFLQLSIGVYVLKQYSSTVYRNRNSEYPTSADCSSPVEYTAIYYPFRIAECCIVVWRLPEFHESLTVIAEDDANVLDNIILYLL